MSRRLAPYLLALAATAVAVVLRLALLPALGEAYPFVTLFGAVAIAVWFAGAGPAVVTTLTGFVLVDVLVMDQRGTFSPLDREHVVGLFAYLFTCGLIIAVGHAARRARSRALEQTEILRVTLASIGDAVITTDPHGRVTYLNAVAEELTGWTSQQAHDEPLAGVFRIVNEDTREPVESPAVRALRDGTIVGLANHTILIRRDGGEIAIDDSAAPIRDSDGRVSGCVLIFRDVTERRRLERAAAERLTAASLLASIVESSDDAIVRKSLDGTIESWNAAAERLFGYTAEEAVGRHISLLIPPERIAEEEGILGALRRGERVTHFETERLARNGRRLRVSLTVSPVRDAAGEIVGASKISRDVTQQRQVESDVRRLAAVIESSTDFVGICDLEGVPFYVNRAGLEMVGLDSAEEAARHTVSDFFFPEDRAQVEELFAQVRHHGHAETEIRFRHFKTGEARWMAYNVIALKDAAGQTEAFATVSHDVTERRRMEDHLRMLSVSLAEADRQKDEFLATLAHELRNPLAPLRSSLEFLRRTDQMPAASRGPLDTMDRQVSQLVRLVDDLLDLNRVLYNRLELRRADVDLASVIHQAVEISTPLIEAARHTLTIELPEQPIHVHADPVRLTQVFANLLNNSVKYTPAGGRIGIRAERSGDRAVIRVQDTGVGIPVDQHEAIFSIFTQLPRASDREREGLGIGLTLVRQLVNMHGGSVRVHSAGAGRGSEFIVELPALPDGAAVAAAPAIGAPAQAPARRVLVVDDNRDAAESLAMLVEHGGHTAVVAHDGAAALAAAERERPDVVLLDIGLPQMNGHDVCREIRKAPWGRDMRVVALTGWGQEEDRRKSRDAGFDAHLVKPVDFDALLKLLAGESATT